MLTNELKPETIPTIKELHNAKVKTVMATGDNPLTSISVGKQGGMINPNLPVYLGELITLKNGEKMLKWSNVDQNESTLDPTTLIPLDLEEEEFKISNRGLMSRSHNISNRSMTRMELDKTIYSHNISAGHDELIFDKGSLPWYMHGMDHFELAITGNAFLFLIQKVKQIKQNNPDHPKIAANGLENKILQKVIKKAKIFSRMTSEEKSHLVKKLKSKDSVVGMGGDGANDGKALKTADIGLSLSEAEASIAAPFTCSVNNIKPIISLLIEGKASLCITFQLFKMMFLSAVIQAAGVFYMYTGSTDFTDYQFLYVDLVILFPIVFFLSLTKSAKHLTHHTIFSSLVSPTILLSIIGQIVIHLGSMFAIIVILKNQDFYYPIAKGYGFYISISYENTTAFLFCNIQYISSLFAYNIAQPFISPIYKNWGLTLWALVSIGITYWLILNPDDFLADQLSIAYLPNEYRYILALATVVNFWLSYIFEVAIVNSCSHILERKSRSTTI